MRKINEECGIFGIISPEPLQAAGYAASAMLALQHRGQEGAGIATFYSDDTLICHKNVGLVNDVFRDFLRHVPCTNVAVGHVRYSTTGNNTVENTQPIETVHSRLTCALAHNGNITNAAELRGQMVNRGGKVFHTTNDTEIINMLLIDEMIKCRNLEQATFNVMNILEGAFSLVIATPDKIVAARDKCGFRPLCMGKLGKATVFASESCAFDCIGADFVRDIEPGELISIDRSGKEKILKQKDTSCRGLCVFEMIYIARSDSFIDGLSVYNARLEMGRMLARQKPTKADFVCGVPDSGLDAALGYSLESGIPFAKKKKKNRYMGRSFIEPSQQVRERTVNAKLNPLRAQIEGKSIILVDDSIVRGTTSERMIKPLRDMGVKEVHLRISSPPFKHPCYFGTDIDSAENLIANHMTVDEICQKIGADSLEYLDMDNLTEIGAKKGIKFCTGCFTGKYPIEVSGGDKHKFDDN